MIAKAARRLEDTISDFVVENAHQMATLLQIDEGAVSLSAKHLAHIVEALDHPPARSSAAVRRLQSSAIDPG